MNNFNRLAPGPETDLKALHELLSNKPSVHSALNVPNKNVFTSVFLAPFSLGALF